MTKQETEKIWAKLSKLDRDMQRILGYLENDDHTNTKGLVNKVRDNSKDIERIKEREKIFKAKTAAYGTVGGGLISIILIVLKEFFSKKIGG